MARSAAKPAPDRIGGQSWSDEWALFCVAGHPESTALWPPGGPMVEHGVLRRVYSAPVRRRLQSDNLSARRACPERSRMEPESSSREGAQKSDDPFPGAGPVGEDLRFRETLVSQRLTELWGKNLNRRGPRGTQPGLRPEPNRLPRRRGGAEKNASGLRWTPASLRLCVRCHSFFHKHRHCPAAIIWKGFSVVAS
jgi:hypothetical protein